MNEKAFQKYFIQKFKPYAHRISLVNSNGFPDILMLLDNRNYVLVELKWLPNNPTPRKKTRPLFERGEKPRQIPWYKAHKEQIKENYFTIIKTPNFYYYQYTDICIKETTTIGNLIKTKKIEDIAFLYGLDSSVKKQRKNNVSKT